MRSIINKFILGTLTVASVSCTGNYMDINSNPYQPGDLSADDYALGSAMNNLASCVVSSDVNTAQFTDCLLGGPMGGYFADSNSSWNNTIANYNATDNWTNVFLKSDRIIPILFTNLTAVETIARNSGNEVPLAIAKIIKVAAMSRVTDTYGPIPYSQIGKDGSVTTPYDSQEVVYDAFFQELSEAVKTLQANPEASLTATADYVYSGNLTKWIKFANSLKLRLAMRIVYANETKARQWAEDAVKADNGGVIEANADNAQWNYFGTVTNPLYTATRYNAAADTETGGDTHAAADIICYMNAYSDPRLKAYFVKSEWGGDNEYVGIRRGIDLSTISNIARKYSGVKVAQSDPIYWMNAAEVAFLRAEAVGVFGFTNVGSDAKTLYEKGVALSFEQWGAGSADGYFTSNNQDKELSYTDPSGANSYGQTDKFIAIAAKWDASASKEQMQQRIITQKWIANWMLGNEAWADFRRTGYPYLMPATESGNKSGGVISNLEAGARRMPYPTDEFISNKENVEYAVANLLKGANTYATRIWWDCKSKAN